MKCCKFAILSLALPTLSACVAAAIPIAAGGAMLRSDAVAGDESSQPAAAPEPSAGHEAAGVELVVLDTDVLPAPSEADIAAGTRQRIAERSFDAFYGYALTQATNDPLEVPMRSAMLVDPSSLDPIRQDCGMLEPLVLIDLDPQAGLFDPAITNHANRALSEVAAVLRARDIEVAWISGQSRDMEGPIRDRLARAELDPRSEDQVLLTDPEFATKQALRSRLSEEHCIVAIAGDEREDFDELYSYLKDPDAALPLDEMYGAGWFLTPSPIE